MATVSAAEPQLRELPSEVFERLNPELFLERHIAAGERPCARGISEFRPIVVRPAQNDQLSSGALGAAVARAGACVVLCGIHGGLTELQGQGGVHVIVETQRGARTVQPPPEEMVLSERAQRLISKAGWAEDAFAVSIPGGEHMIYRELVLTASIRVLSRTGPCFDVVWAALVAALKDAMVPEFYFDESAQRVCASAEKPLQRLSLPAGLPIYAATTGIYQCNNGKRILLADPEGPTEERCTPSRAVACLRENGSFAALTMALGDAPLSKSEFISIISVLQKQHANIETV